MPAVFLFTSTVPHELQLKEPAECENDAIPLINSNITRLKVSVAVFFKKAVEIVIFWLDNPTAFKRRRRALNCLAGRSGAVTPGSEAYR